MCNGDGYDYANKRLQITITISIYLHSQKMKKEMVVAVAVAAFGSWEKMAAAGEGKIQGDVDKEGAQIA